MASRVRSPPERTLKVNTQTNIKRIMQELLFVNGGIIDIECCSFRKILKYLPKVRIEWSLFHREKSMKVTLKFQSFQEFGVKHR